MQTVYVTKYALSQGIFAIDAEINSRGYAIEIVDDVKLRFLRECDYALTPEDAVKQAEERRIKKLKSLDAQIKKISALDFVGML